MNIHGRSVEANQGASVLVIGGATPNSIGGAVAQLLARNKMQVFVPTIDELDVTSEDSVYQYIKLKGPFSHTIYSAGVQQLSFLKDLPLHGRQQTIGDAWDIMDVNTFGYLRVVKALVNTQDEGNVCALVSNAMDTPMRGSIAYCISKAALAMAIRTAARELAPYWILTGIAPGPVAGTSMSTSVDQQVMRLRGWTRASTLEYERNLIPMGMRSTMGDVAQLVVSTLFGSVMLTGQIISITGGRT